MIVFALLIAALIQTEIRYVSVSDGCPPCRAMERDVGYGDSELLVLYRHAVLPPGANAYPAILNPATGQVTVGYQTLAQMKAKPVAAPAKQGRWESRMVWVRQGRRTVLQWQNVWVEK